MNRGNWFVALPVDAGGWYGARVPAPPPSTRRFAAEDLHLTVAFLGGVGEERALAAWQAAEAGVRGDDGWPWHAAPFEITLGAVAPMGNPRRATALAARVEDGREAVEEAMGATRDGIWRAADARADRRAPKAHISLARILRGATPVERDLALEWAMQLDLGAAEVRLDRLALYAWASERPRGERQFQIVREMRL